MPYSFAYKMNNGSVITRTYSASVYDSFSSDTIDTSEIVNTKTYTEKYTAALNANQSDISRVTVKTNEMSGCVSDDTDKSKEDFGKVVEAFRKDFKADNSDISVVLAPAEDDVSLYSDYYGLSSYYEVKDFKYYQKEYPDAVCLLEVNTGENSYSNPSDLINDIIGGSFSVYDIMPKQETYLIPKSYTNTISALKEIGVLNSDNTINENSDYYKSLDVDY